MVCYGRFQEEREEVKTQKPILLPAKDRKKPQLLGCRGAHPAGDSVAKWNQKNPLKTRNLENADRAGGDYKHPLIGAEIIAHPCAKIMILYLVPYHRINQK